MVADRVALGAFLRSRRDRLSPAQAGIRAFPGPRRVPGLRKEELAVLAGLSPDHYSRIEQGRQSTLTEDLLDALSRALQLDDLERAHLRHLAAPTARRHRPDAGARQRADPGLLRVMATLGHVPTLLLGRRSEVLADNALLRAVLGTTFETGAPFVRWLLVDPAAREMIANWSDFAAAAVASLRFEVGSHPGDRRLATLVDELRRADPEIAAWWDDHDVADRPSVRKRITHPIAGPLDFGIEAVTTPLDPEQRLVIYTVEPDSDTARALPLLAGWTVDDPSATSP